MSWGEIFLGLSEAVSKRAFGNIFQGSSRFEASHIPYAEPSFEVRAREPSPDELALGWTVERDEAQNKNVQQLVGMANADRATHMYAVGASGTGKTKFLESLIRQDINQGRGFGVIDPHGDLIEDVKAYLFSLRGKEKEDAFLSDRIVLIDPTDPIRTVSFNPLERIPGKLPEEQASELLLAFKKIWADAWGARMESLLRFTLIALCENSLTLAEIPLFLTNRDLRERVLLHVSNTPCQDYFDEFNRKPARIIAEWIESTLNKVNAFLADPRIRQIVAADKSSFHVRNVMDEGKILLVKLDRGQLKDAADLLGSLLLSTIQMAAFSRTDIPQSERIQFYLYIDEFQNFASENFIETLDQARKYKLSLILANQNLSQLSRALQASILGNCNIQAYFRVAHDDASILARESLDAAFPEAGRDECTRLLQELPPRALVVKNKQEGGVAVLRSQDIASAWEQEGMEERAYRILVAAAGMGIAYLQDRSVLEAEYQDRRRRLLEGGEDVQPASFRERDISVTGALAETKRRAQEVWPQIEEDLAAGDKAHLHNAVIGAEKILEATLKALGYEGGNTAEKLENMRQGALTNLGGLKEARRARNGVAHDARFELTYDVAQFAVAMYRQALVDLGVLEKRIEEV